MDHLQSGLIAEYIAGERYAALLAEGEARRLARLARPALPWREEVARRLVAVALRIAPADSAIRRGPAAPHALARG